VAFGRQFSRRAALSEEEELRKAVEQRKSQDAAKAQDTPDPILSAIAEWAERVAPAIAAAVRDANKLTTDAGIKFAVRPLMAQRRITPEGTTEFPAIAIEKSSGRGSLASRLPGSAAVPEDHPLMEPYLDMRLGLNARVAVTALGCSITRSGEFSLDDFSEEQIKDTVLEFAKAVVELPEKF
jgi:hypothetical protein